MGIFAYALGTWRFYYPAIAFLLIGYLLNTASGSQEWALDGLSLVLVANALDRLYFLSAQVAYFRALTESPDLWEDRRRCFRERTLSCVARL